MACNDKNKCVTPVSSSCVMYTGTKLLSVDETKLKCSVTITDVVQEMDLSLNVLQKLLSSKTLIKRCFNFDKDKVQQYELNQMFIDKICDLADKVGTSSSVNYDDVVGNAVIDVNCTLSNCDGVNTKKLKDLIQMLCNEVIELKKQVGLSQSTSNNSTNSNIYIPNV